MQHNFDTLHVEIAKNICNQKCKFCYITDHPTTNIPAHYLDSLKVIEEISSQYDFAEIIVQGGEITIIPEVFRFCSKLIQKPKTLLSIITNGVGFDQKWNSLFGQQGNIVSISLNTTTAESHHQLCGGNNFEKIISNIKNFNKTRKKYPTPNCLLSLSMVVCTETLPLLKNFYILCTELEADIVHFYPDITSSLKLIDKNKTLAHKYFEELLDYIQETPGPACYSLEALARNINYSKPFINTLNHSVNTRRENLTSEDCLAPWKSFFISTDTLDVFPCCHCKKKLGNLQEQSFTEILASQDRQELQQAIQQKNFSFCSPACNYYH